MTIIIDRNRIKPVIFSVIIALLPLLSSYSAGLPSVEWGTVLILVFLLCNFPKKTYRNPVNIVVSYVVFITPIALILLEEHYVSFSLIALRTIKFAAVLGAVFFFGLYQEYYDELVAINTLKIVVYISCMFIVLQRLIYGFTGIIIKNPLLHYAINETYFNSSYMTNMIFRPCAFFLEPADMTTYCMVFLIFSLYRSRNVRDMIVPSVAILCTGSGTGIVLLTLHIIIYTLYSMRKNLIKGFGIVFVSIFTIIFLSRMSFIQSVISRFTTSNVGGGGNALNARIGIGYELFEKQPLIAKLIGRGYGNVIPKVYLNGASYALNTIGIIGILLFFIVVYRLAYRNTGWKIIGLVTMLVIFATSQIFSATALSFYFSIYGKEKMNKRCWS